MNTLRPICLVLAGVSLLVTMACGMGLYIMEIGRSSDQFHQSSQNLTKQLTDAPDVAAIRSLCLPLARAFNAQSSALRDDASVWRNSLLVGLCWAVLSAIMFAWVFAVLRSAGLETPAAGLTPQPMARN